jgi:DNA processing protein
MLGWKLEDFKTKPQQKQLFVELSVEEKVIYDYLKDNEKKGLDIIALNCKIRTSKASSLLLSMEFKGVIRPLPGKLFQII